jgi:hypothetical protein
MKMSTCPDCVPRKTIVTRGVIYSSSVSQERDKRLTKHPDGRGKRRYAYPVVCLVDVKQSEYLIKHRLTTNSMWKAKK